MKTLFLVLLLANVVLFAWYYRMPPPMSTTGSPAAAQAQALKLLEPGTSAHPPVADDEVKTPPAQAVYCVRVGPLHTRETATAVTRVLETAGFDVAARMREEEFKVGDWVYLPPLDSREEALARAAGLREQGIEDIYVVAADEWRNAVALGLYSNDGSVQRRLEQLRELGVDAQVRARIRTREVLDIYGWSGDSGAAQELAEAGGVDQELISEVSCGQLQNLQLRL